MRQRRKWTWLAALAVVALIGCRRHDDAAAPLAHTFLWSAEKDGKISYFFGTMHQGVDPARLPPIVWEKLQASPVFAMESDTQDPKLKGFGIRHDGSTLHAELGDLYWRKLEDAVTPKVARALDQRTAAVAAVVLDIQVVPHTPLMDKALRAKAESEHKQLAFLEPAGTGSAVLAKWLDVRALERMLDELEFIRREAIDMSAAYGAGDPAQLDQLLARDRAFWREHGRSDAEYEQQMAELRYDRSASWIDPIERLHAAGGAFVAVGALHLVGKRSVLELLAARGYKVTRLTP